MNLSLSILYFTAALLYCTVYLCIPVSTRSQCPIPQLNVSLSSPVHSVSGLSAGGFMAIQMHIAHSSIFQGVGVFAGGPYHCAQGSVAWALSSCMQGIPPVSVPSLIDIAELRSTVGQIDPITNLPNQRVYLYTGLYDSTVAHSVVTAATQFYTNWITQNNSILFEQSIASGHTMPTNIENNMNFSSCASTESPFISNCQYDGAGIALQHIYANTLHTPSSSNNGPLSGKFIQFSQAPYVPGNVPSEVSMGDTGYMYIPQSCASGTVSCRIHVILHGCEQTIPDIGLLYITSTGYNRWADINQMILLYPQVIRSVLLGNPEGCWNWWGYLNNGAKYDTKAGAQIESIYAMMQSLEKSTHSVADACVVDAL